MSNRFVNIVCKGLGFRVFSGIAISKGKFIADEHMKYTSQSLGEFSREPNDVVHLEGSMDNEEKHFGEEVGYRTQTSHVFLVRVD